MHSIDEEEVPRLERATSVVITRKASRSKTNLRLKPKTVKARRPPPPPPPESPTNPSVHFNYDLNTSIASANTSDVESDSEFSPMITKSARSEGSLALPSSNATKNIVKRARSASENIARRHSLVSRFKGYFAAGEKELTEEQKKKQQEREERRLGKAREAALIKVYKYTTIMEKRYKKMLKKLQETMETMKICSAEWGREMQELKSWGVLPAVLKAREKLASLRRHVRQLELHIQTKECDIVSTHNEAAKALIKEIETAQDLGFTSSLDQQLFEPQELFESNVKLQGLRESLFEAQEEMKQYEKEYNSQHATSVKQVKSDRQKKRMIEAYLDMMATREAMFSKGKNVDVERKYQCFAVTKGNESFQALLYDVRMAEGKVLADKLQEYESLVSTAEAPTCDDLVEFYTGFVEMVTRNYQVIDPDSQRRLSALCESVLYPRLHPYTQHALRVESSDTVKHFVEHRVWLRRLHPLHFAIDPKFLPKDLRTHEDTGDGPISRKTEEAAVDPKQKAWQCAQEDMYVESRKALTKFAEIHSQNKANLPPRVLTSIMRLVHTIHVEAQEYCSDSMHAEDFFPLLVWCCIHCDDTVSNDLPLSVLFAQKFAIDARSVPREVVAEVCYYFTSVMGAVQWIASLVEGSEALKRLEKQRRKNILHTRCGSIMRSLMGGSNVDTLFGVSTTPTERSPEGHRPSRGSYSDLL